MSETAETVLRAATQELKQAGIEDALGDARRLLAHALEIEPGRLTLALKDPVSPSALQRLDAAIRARLERQPVSHIIGKRAFWGRDFRVTPAVLDPRPETEILIEVALSKPFNKVLDLGTGSGCILLTLLAERAQASGVGVDFSPEALEIAKENREVLGLSRRALLAQSDWFERVVGSFDLIVSNPPYIALPEMAGLEPEVLRWEPMAALSPGLTGLESYETIAAEISPFLNPAGRVLLEIGPSQADAVRGIFERQGLRFMNVHKDLDGRDRVVELQFPG